MRPNIKIKTKLAREGSLRRKPHHEALWDRSWGILGAFLGAFGRSGATVGALLGMLGTL